MENSIAKCVKVRKWCETQTIIPLYLSDSGILNFLVHCDNDVDKTCERLLEFYTVRCNSAELFNNRRLNRPQIQRQLKILEIGLIPVPTDEGHCIFISRIVESSPWAFHMDESLRVYLMALDMMLQQRQHNGLILVYDMSFLRTGHLTRIRFGVLTKFLQYILNYCPIPIVAIHMLNVIPIYDYVLTLFKKIVGSEFIKKVNLHRPGCNMENFYKIVPKKCLPNDFGGDLPRMESLNTIFNEELEMFTKLFEEEEEKRTLSQKS